MGCLGRPGKMGAWAALLFIWSRAECAEMRWGCLGRSAVNPAPGRWLGLSPRPRNRHCRSWSENPPSVPPLVRNPLSVPPLVRNPPSVPPRNTPSVPPRIKISLLCCGTHGALDFLRSAAARRRGRGCGEEQARSAPPGARSRRKRRGCCSLLAAVPIRSPAYSFGLALLYLLLAMVEAPLAMVEAPLPAVALPYVSYNHYILLDIDGNTVEVARDDAVGLVQLADASDDAVGLLQLPNGSTFVSTRNDQTASDEARKIVKSVLKSLWSNVLYGVCFTEFDETNILVTKKWKVRFKNVSIRRNLTPEQLAEGTRNNYRSARAIIGHVIFAGKPPPEIVNLLSVIQKDEELRHFLGFEVVERRGMFHYHDSLFPVASYGCAALPYVSYNRYILLDAEGSTAEDARDDAIELGQFAEDVFIMRIVTLVSTRKGQLVLPGELDYGAGYEIATEASKKIVRSILEALWSNVLDGVCFTEFDENNIVVSKTWKVRFKNVSIRRNLTPEQLAEGTRNNYRSARAIIGHVIFAGKPPPEFVHLLSLMQKDEDLRHLLGFRFFENPEGRELFHIHASLLPAVAYGSALKAMYDEARFGFKKEKFRDFLLRIPEGYVEDVILSSSPPDPNVMYWQNEIRSNSLLMRTYQHPQSNYRPPVGDPKQTCMRETQKKALANLGITPEAKQIHLTAEQLRMAKILQFLEYLRNRNAHRLEPYWWWVDQGKISFNAEGSELIVHVRFPVILSEMQYIHYEFGTLENISMNAYNI